MESLCLGEYGMKPLPDFLKKLILKRRARNNFHILDPRLDLNKM